MTTILGNSVGDPDRLAALRKVALVDSSTEEAFDRLTRLACATIDVPVALVSLVEEDRQYFKSCVGLPEPWLSRRETPLTHSFCQHLVNTAEPLVVSDARKDSRFCDNQAIQDLNVIAYAGMPLITPAGYVLGSFCVIDSRSRQWQPAEQEILRDLSLSVMTEIELRATIDREKAALAEASAATADYQRVVEQLKQVDRRKTRFLATLSHELRNPLAALSNAVEVVGMLSHPAQEWPEIRDVMKQQIDQMTALISDLMDISRIGEGKVELDHQRVPLQGLISSAVETISAQCQAAGHDLVLDLPEEPVSIEADPCRLTQVVTNLLTNACKYTPSGGRITLQLQPEEDDVVIRVADNGIGIAADRLERIFDMFDQLDKGRGRRDGGIGIGLALVRRIVELHGGAITVHSDGERRGSTFTVRLPRRQRPDGSAVRRATHR